MRVSTARIAPLSLDECNAEQRAVLEPYANQGRLYNIFATLGRNPQALQAFTAWGGYVLRKTDLAARDRELVILRVGYVCRAGYEWAQHSRLGKQSGLTDAEIERIKRGADAAEWDARDRLLIQATDEQLQKYFISDSTWASLEKLFDDRQRADLVYVVAHYTQVCMILNTFGIQLDADLKLDPDLTSPSTGSGRTESSESF